VVVLVLKKLKPFVEMKNQPNKTTTSFERIPPKSRSITSIGDQTTNAAVLLFPKNDQLLLDNSHVDDGLDLDPLTDAFKQGKWTDAEAANVVSAYASLINEGKIIDVKTLARWVFHHPNDSEQTIECLNTSPPDEIEIIKVLSRAGSQKVVFLATWRLTQADVVLKKVIANTEATERILSRELRAHPMNMVHQNIIETYILKNSANESFLVEKKLSDVLYDGWRSKGIHEAANLLFDIGKALKFLHDKGLVHGDVKPDNLGKRGESYVLLDFGICREKAAYTPESTPTGSLRTRAPELLMGNTLEEPEKVDVWALGATVYNSIKGRFPLIPESEKIPRISTPEQRSQFEQVLKARVENEWDKWVNFEDIPDSIGSILKRMLEKDPSIRISAKEVIEHAKGDLYAFIRSVSVYGEASARFSPVEELSQINQYLNSYKDMAGLLPLTKKKTIQDRLVELGKAVGFGDEERRTISRLNELVSK